MSTSLNWLKTYFDEQLPSPKEVENGIIFHSFEVEGMEEKNGDTLLEIKILPDRAHDCLCHYGIAGEISAIFDLPKRSYSSDYRELRMEFPGPKPARHLEVKIDCPDLCRRYIGRMVENITIGSSPSWLKERLESIGQRSISNIVDATNYVLFDIGQPMHAFDADKVKGNIAVRRAKDGEKMTTLDGKEVCLTAEMMVIADEIGPLALAGIKGGNRAEVDAKTKNIILESANFDPVNIRRTSAAVGIRTDASKRYENDLSPEVADEAMDRLTSLIYDIAGGDALKIGERVDTYPIRDQKRIIEITPAYINGTLGIEIPVDLIAAILERLDIKVTKQSGKLELEIPFRRVDLEAPENIAEEVGRLYGYDKIPGKLLEAKMERDGEKPAEKRYRVANKIREILVKQGWSEVYGYSFVNIDSGMFPDSAEYVEVANPLAADKPYLRTNLSDWLSVKLTFNLQYVLFDVEPVKIFEIGRVFIRKGEEIKEETHLALGIISKAKKFDAGEEMAKTIQDLKESLHLPVGQYVTCEGKLNDNKGKISESSFDKIAENAGDFSDADLASLISPAKEYKKISAYPRIIRDVALWVSEGVTEEEVKKVIIGSAGQLLVEGPVKFDEFHKDGRMSLAFRQVFQSYDKTLSDEEVNGIMDKVVSALEAKGWEVRS